MDQSDIETLRGLVERFDFITENIAVTNFVAAHAEGRATELGFVPEGTLCLDKNVWELSPKDGRTVIDLVDGSNPLWDFENAVDTLARLAAVYPKVLVYCRAGRSRSPSVVAGYLVKYRNMVSHEALAFVEEKRPCSSIMPGLRESVMILGNR